MVAIMATHSRKRVASLLDSVNFASTIPSKLQYLEELKSELSSSDAILLSEFLSGVLELLSDQFSPVRKFVAQMIGEIGSTHLELLPVIVPALMPVFHDKAPAVARQAIASATRIFRSTLEKVALQGLYTSELDDSLQLAWASMTKMKEKIYSIAFQSGSDGRRVLSLKFVEAVILIYTPDPSGSSEPPTVEGKAVDINMSWLRKGHPLLNVGDLSVEASERLRLLLDQLRSPAVKSLGVSMMIVLVNSLSVVATKRPSFYGRILPVLLGLDASNSVVKGIHAYGLQHALTNAFLSCLKCTYSSARPWRDRLVGALKEMKVGGLADKVVEEVCSLNSKVKEEESDLPITQEEPSAGMIESVRSSKGKKRCGDQEFGATSEDGDTPGKRLKSTSLLVEGSLRMSIAQVADKGISSSAQSIACAESESGPVQQLVAVFGALVAQGDKVAASLDVLIASIATDMLAEVVIANMKHLPPACPNAEGDGETMANSGSDQNMLESDSQFGQLSLFLSNAISSSVSAQMTSEMDVQQPTANEMKDHVVKEECPSVFDGGHDGASVSMDEGANKTMSSSLPVASDADGFSDGKGFSSLTVGFQDTKDTDAGIPGLENVPNDGYSGLAMSTSLVATDLDGGSQDLDKSLVKSSEVDSLPSISTDRSEESCPKALVADANSVIASTATSSGSIQHIVLPKVAAPVIGLTDEEKDEIQKVSFARIVKAYKQVAISGGSQLRFSLLAYLGVEFPLELDPWTIIQQHILSDYVNHEGHELTLLVLYRLYKESEDCDFFSSTTATSVYEMFLLKVAETLQDSFPPSDKSLSRLLSEVPYLPKSIFELLKRLCCPDNGKEDKESQTGDRVTQGLSTVWSLILLRPALRDVLLKIALQSAVHHMEEVRMKAIRLVANKLYPLSSLSLQIEEFAKNMLIIVVKNGGTIDTGDAESSSNQSQKNSGSASPSDEDPSSNATSKDISNAHQSDKSGETSDMLISEARKCMSLYFALCTKKHSLLRQIFSTYKISPPHVKQAVHFQMPILVRTMGASPMVLEIISDPPEGSQNLLMEVLHTLTDGTLPSPPLMNSIKGLYESKGKDVEILFPILSFLPKEEVLQIFPSLVNLPGEKFQAALTRLLQGSAPSNPVLTPEEVLIAIHGIDPEKDRIPLKKVTDACNSCFEQRQIFTQQVLAKVLNQLVEQIPLPLLFMRTVLQAIGAFPALVEFIMIILSRLVNKQIWKFPKLWVGFLKCAQLTQPHSFSVLLQVPSAQLEGALNKIPALKAPLVAHAGQPEVRSTLTRSTLVVLGLLTDSQNVSPAQAAVPAETADGGGLVKDETTERK